MATPDECLADFDMFLGEIGVTREQMDETRESMGACANSPEVLIRPSYIEGMGAFSRHEYLPGELIGFAKHDGEWTNLGRYMNHSPDPNAEMIGLDDVRAVKTIKPFEEITISYRAAKLSMDEVAA